MLKLTGNTLEKSSLASRVECIPPACLTAMQAALPEVLGKANG